LYLQNRLEQTNGRGPSGRILTPGDDIMRFDVIEATAEDASCVPQRLRQLPAINMNEIKRRRAWQFDYRGGVWKIKGKGAGDLSVVSVAIAEGSAEMWT